MACGHTRRFVPGYSRANTPGMWYVYLPPAARSRANHVLTAQAVQQILKTESLPFCYSLALSLT